MQRSLRLPIHLITVSSGVYRPPGIVAFEEFTLGKTNHRQFLGTSGLSSERASLLDAV
jgi:hypothetical protein